MSDNNTELAVKFKQATDKVKEIAEELQGKMANGEKLLQSTTEKADEALVAMNEIKLRLDDLEQKDARRGFDDSDYRTLGEKFAQSDEYKQLKDHQGNEIAILLILGTLYAHREDVATGVSELPMSAKFHLQPYRVMGV